MESQPKLKTNSHSSRRGHKLTAEVEWGHRWPIPLPPSGRAENRLLPPSSSLKTGTRLLPPLQCPEVVLPRLPQLPRPLGQLSSEVRTQIFEAEVDPLYTFEVEDDPKGKGWRKKEGHESQVPGDNVEEVALPVVTCDQGSTRGREDSRGSGGQGSSDEDSCCCCLESSPENHNIGERCTAPELIERGDVYEREDPCSSSKSAAKRLPIISRSIQVQDTPICCRRSHPKLPLSVRRSTNFRLFCLHSNPTYPLRPVSPALRATGHPQRTSLIGPRYRPSPLLGGGRPV